MSVGSSNRLGITSNGRPKRPINSRRRGDADARVILGMSDGSGLASFNLDQICRCNNTLGNLTHLFILITSLEMDALKRLAFTHHVPIH